MKIQKPSILSLLHALSVVAYIVIVVFIINSISDTLNEKPDNLWGPVLMLMLFVVSAAITGILVLGRPIFMYLNDQKKEGIKFLIYTISWLFVIMISFFAIYITFI